LYFLTVKLHQGAQKMSHSNYSKCSKLSENVFIFLYNIIEKKQKQKQNRKT